MQGRLINIGLLPLLLTCFVWLLALVPVNVHAVQFLNESEDEIYSEEVLTDVFTALQKLDFKKAIYLSEKLVEEFPNYKMARTLHADLLAIRSGQPELLKNIRKRHSSRTEAFQKEGLLRWNFVNHQAEAFNRSKVLKTSNDGYFILINAYLHRLFLYRQTSQGLKKIEDFYISLGRGGMGKEREGDMKTPLGIYLIDSWIDGDELPDLYGEGALTLNYPNAWDRKLNRTGDGIWLHGTPAKTYTRSPLASRGCVVLTNPAMLRLRYVHGLGEETPVMIVSGKDEEIQGALISNLDILNQVQQYLQQSEMGAIWSSLSVMRYPSEDNLYYIHFRTEQGIYVEQFWQSMNGQWQAVLQNKLSDAQLVSSE